LTRKVRFDRASGILLHPTSLPGRYGIGDFGPGAFRFVDWLIEANQSLWQVCPLGPTGYGDSPYQCLSAFAGNPLLVSLERVRDQGLLLESELVSARANPGDVDFGRVIPVHAALLQRAWERFERSRPISILREFDRFIEGNSAWLEDYSLFAALKDEAEGAPWYRWEDGLRVRNPVALDRARNRLAPRIRYHHFVQYLFFSQWAELRRYANVRGVSIIGDMPIFAAHDSAECWARPDLFQFDENLEPLAVAGVPPDYFSKTGQLWGNPLYRWEAHRAEGYRWWIDLFRSRFRLFDRLRVDHFRGFEAYWSVPWGSRTAEKGRWTDGPGRDLFDTIFDVLGPLPVIAEDLGVITDTVVELMDHCGFPGMKILQFAFDSGDPNDYIPHNYDAHSVTYTGTHDNDTIVGWAGSASAEDREYAFRYLDIRPSDEINWRFIRGALGTVSDTAIIPMQDVLGLGPESRMNVPGTTGGNWNWRLREPDPADATATSRLAELTGLYGRSRGMR
jgi:4-alpha-glucanotransferase